MTREEMIAILHTLPFAYVDDLPDAGFTERPLWVNSKGYGYLSCDDPSDYCWDGEGIAPQKWESIRESIASNSLQLDDLQDTSLVELLDVMYFGEFPEDENPCEYLRGLLALPVNPVEHIYCMNTIEGWQFFATEEAFKAAYERDWCDYEWTELSDESLAECIDQFAKEGLLKVNN